MKLMDKRLAFCLSLMMCAPLVWADIVSDNSSMYGPDLGDRLVVASHNGRYFICNDPKLGDSSCTGKSSDWTAPYATPDEAIKSAVSKGYCGQPDYRTLTCYTGVGSSTESNGEVGAPATTTNSSPKTSTGKSCGSMVNGKWIEKSCTEPELPSVTPPKPRELTAQEKELIEAFKKLRDRYVAAFKSISESAKAVKAALAKKLEWCINAFGAGNPNHLTCAKNAQADAQKQIAEIQERMSKTQAQMEKDFAELEKQIPNSGSVGSINVNFGNGVQDSGGVNVTVNNNGNNSTNPTTGGSTTVNNNNSSNSSNTTVNNTTVNNGGSNTIIKNGSNTDSNQADNSAQTGLLSDIKGILNTISDKVGKIGSGGDTAQSGETGSGGKGDPNGKENGEEHGETMSEFCEKNPQHLSCTKLGSKGEIEDAIAVGKGNDGRGFGIGNHEIGIPSMSKTHYFVEMGSCPSPKILNIMKTKHEISYQPMCDGALKIRPFVIFCAVFIAFGIAHMSIQRS